MILNNNVTIKINNSNLNYYKKLGYDVTPNDITSVNVKDLSKGSHILIDVKCDICSIEKKIKYNSLYKNDYLTEYMCVKCKRKNNLKEKYGVENIFQLNSTKNKIKETNLKKYGVEYITQSIDIKNKIKNTNIEKYGKEHHLQNENIKNKIKTTNMKRYGVDNISKLERIKKKKEKTCYKNFGVKYISQTDFFKDIINEKVIKKLKIKYKKDIIGVDDYNYFIKCEICEKIYEIHKKTFMGRMVKHIEPCTYCNPINSFSISNEEKKLKTFIENNYENEIISNSRKIIHPYELDIYLPDLKLAFEFNGLYYHNELSKSKNYHLIKTEYCDKKKIKLIHIYEDDWLYKQDIVKSRILNLLSKSEKIYARKCEIKDVTSKNARLFLVSNHIQGFVGSKHYIGLYYKDELVSLMTFGKKRKFMNSSSDEGEFELTRFCNILNTTVIGGASKLFKHFIRNYDPKEIISYAYRSWSQGSLYEQLEFEFLSKTQPNYFYIVDGIRKHRFGFRKDKLVKEGYNSNKTEHQIMLDRKLYRIYDSGHLKYSWNSNQI